MSTHVGIGMLDGRARFQGLIQCGLVWVCPVCTASIRAERADEVRKLYTWHKGNDGDVLMLTLTVRHGLGDDLERVRRGVANAWRAMQAGKQWQQLKHQAGLVGYVRALETTNGGNGWHPHLHILLLLPPMTARAISALRERLSVRWQSAVSRQLGRDHVPNDHLGCDLRSAHEADYITKLGLEISDVATKRGRNGNRTPWEIAADLVTDGLVTDVRLWQQYVEGIKGARMLTWSRGLRAAAGLGVELTDDEIMAREERAYSEQTVLLIESHVWDMVRWGDTERLLFAAENGNEAGVRAALHDLLRQRDSSHAQVPP